MVSTEFLSEQEIWRAWEYFSETLFPAGLMKQSHPIPQFYYSGNPSNSVLYQQVAMADTEESSFSLQPCSLSRIFAEKENVVLITGKPGVGKTAVLHLIATCCVLPPLRRMLVGEDESLLIPVLLHARDIPYDGTLGGMVIQRLTRILGCSWEEATEWFRNRPESLVVIVDGLDEVRKHNSDLLAWMAERIAYRPGCRVIVAGRPEAASSLSQKTVYILAPMSSITQLSYVTGRLIAAGLTNPQQAEDRAAAILEQLSAVWEMLGNRLFLDIAIDAAISGSALLPDHLCDAWIRKIWERAMDREINPESQEKLTRAAEVLAWHFQEGGYGLETELETVLTQAGLNGTRSLITDLCRVGLLIRAGGELYPHQRRYALTYRTIQSLLVARQLRQRGNNKKVFAFLKNRMTLPEWEQPLSFYLMTLDQQNRSRFLSQIVKAKLPGDKIQHRKLSLLSNLVRLTGAINENKDYWRSVFLSALRQHRGELPGNVIETAIRAGGDEAVSYLVNLLCQHQGNRHQGNREEIVLALGRSKSESAIPVLLNILRDDTDDACYAAVVALSNMGQAATKAIIQVPIETLSPDARHRAVRAVGIAGAHNEDVRNYLLNALLLPDSTFLAVCDVALELESYPILMTALYPKHTRGAAVMTLKRMPPPPTSTLQTFVDLVNDYPELRGAFAEVVSAWHKADVVVSTLFKFLEDEDPTVRKSVAKALGKVRSQETVEQLIRLLTDEDPMVARAAARSLGEIGFTEAVLPLIKTVESTTDNFLRADAILALGKIKDPRAVCVLTGALESPDDNVRLAAIEALGEIGDVQAIPALLSVSAHERLYYAVAVALTKMNNEMVVPQLLRILREEQDTNRRKMAVAALGMMKSVDSVPYIVKALQSDETMRMVCIQALREISTDRSVRALKALARDYPKTTEAIVAVEALGEIGKHSREAVNALIDIAWVGSDRIKIYAIVALGKLKDKRATGVLIRAASSDNEMIRHEAVHALGEIPSTSAISVLTEKLRDPSPTVRDEAIRSLAKILSRLVYMRTHPIFDEVQYQPGVVVVHTTNRSARNYILRVARALKRASRKRHNYNAFRVAVETEIRVKATAKVNWPANRNIACSSLL